jgi:hypothetical protein
MNEKNISNCAAGFSSGGCVRAEGDSCAQLLPSTNSFKYYARYNGRYRRAAPTSAIAHRNGENLATTGERPAGRIGKGEPYG